MPQPDVFLKHGARRHRVDKPVFTIGRDTTCDLSINDEQLSRKHSLLLSTEESYILIDFKSSNGVQVNNKRIDEQVLSNGDRIRMGNQEFVFHCTPGRRSLKPAGASPAGSEAAPPHAAEGEDPSSLSDSFTKSLKQDTLSLLKNKQLNREDDYNKLLILYKVSKVLNSELDIKVVLGNVMDLALEVLYADRGFTMLVNEKGELVPVVSRTVEKPGERGQILPISRSIAHFTFERGEPVLTQDALVDRRFQQSGSIQMYNIRSAMSVCLEHKGRRIGVLYVDNRIQSSCFEEQDLNLLIAFAEQVAMAIENSRLYHSLKGSLEKIKQQQDALVMQEKLAAMGQLSAGVAHEIRNPLAAISGFVQLYFKKETEDHWFFGKMKHVQTALDRMNRIVQSMLGLARKGEKKLEAANVNKVLEETLVLTEASLVKRGRIEVKRDFAPTLPDVHIDRHQIQQVFVNLILNAAEAMKDSGTLTISTRPEHVDGDASQISHVQILFADTGPGIPLAIQEQIFQPFYTQGKAEGTGLGLSISKSIIESHKGTITFESAEDQGTTFCIRLPA